MTNEEEIIDRLKRLESLLIKSLPVKEEPQR